MIAVPDSVSAAPFRLEIPLPRMLTSKEELGLYRAAYASAPASVPVRLTLARQLVLANLFDEVIGLLELWALDDYRFLDLETQALLSRETDAADRRVVDAVPAHAGSEPRRPRTGQCADGDG